MRETPILESLREETEAISGRCAPVEIAQPKISHKFVSIEFYFPYLATRVFKLAQS